MKQQKLTKKKFKDIEENLSKYLTANTTFTIEGYGGSLLDVIMALQLFSEREEMPNYIAQ